jgi:hypothetical protein
MTVEIYEKLKKILEDSIENRKIESRDIYTIIETINKKALLMRAWCLENLNKEFERFCTDFETLVSLIIRTLTYFALNKAILRQLNTSDDGVGFTVRHVLGIIESFWKLAQNSLLLTDGGALCRVLKPFQIRYSITLPGYVIYLPLALALPLFAMSYVEIIEAF